MTLYKRATCSSQIVSSSSVYVCSNCDHTEMAKNASGSRTCPKCGAKLTIVSANAQPDLTVTGSVDEEPVEEVIAETETVDTNDEDKQDNE